MKNTKIFNKIVMTFILLFLFFTKQATAQNTANIKDKTAEERANFQTEWMKEKLGLDSAQVKKVQYVNLKYAQKNDPILKSDEGKFSKFRQLKALQKEKEAELKRIFTTEQYKQYQALEEALKDKMKERMRKQ